MFCDASLSYTIGDIGEARRLLSSVRDAFDSSPLLLAHYNLLDCLVSEFDCSQAEALYSLFDALLCPNSSERSGNLILKGGIRCICKDA